MASGHTVNWFEIPVTDIARASKFYSSILNVKMETGEYGPTKMAVFPSNNQNCVHGALVQGNGYTPSQEGTLVYLNGGEDLSTPLARVKAAGGKILQEKMPIGEHGFIAIFNDTEGNRIAFHSMK